MTKDDHDRAAKEIAATIVGLTGAALLLWPVLEYHEWRRDRQEAKERRLNALRSEVADVVAVGVVRGLSDENRRLYESVSERWTTDEALIKLGGER